MRSSSPLHPFPARMAPEIALEKTRSLVPGSVVLDPMAGSGTVLRIASEAGCHGIGFDLDPLAVLMARVWTAPCDTEELYREADKLIDRAQSHKRRHVRLSWIDGDDETREFIDYWFAWEQQDALRRLSHELHTFDGTAIVGDALRLALSRIIITKDKGASLGRDVSHSRPHKVASTNSFDVYAEFRKSVERVCKRMAERPAIGNVDVRIGDARQMSVVPPASVDAIITSPPYLNAIDYLRGHRLSLVWFGYQIKHLRNVRSTSIGTERKASPEDNLVLARDLQSGSENLHLLPGRERLMLDRFALDLHQMTTECSRVLRPGGIAVYVVGNSTIKGVFVRNSETLRLSAQKSGLQLVEEIEREIPDSKRYLPPPSPSDVSSLTKRMRIETVFTFIQK